MTKTLFGICSVFRRSFGYFKGDKPLASCYSAALVALDTCKFYGCRDISFTGECTACYGTNFLAKNCIQEIFREECTQGFSLKILYKQRHQYNCEEAMKASENNDRLRQPGNRYTIVGQESRSNLDQFT